MKVAIDHLPEKHEELKKIVVDLYQEVQFLREQNRLLTHQIYGRKSEKQLPEEEPRQPSLFGSTEVNEPEETEKVEVIEVPTHKRKKRGRKKLSESLRRIEIEHDIPEEEKQCECGCELSRIGADCSEQLEYIPAQAWVLKNVRYKYACKNCEGTESEGPTVKIAPRPVQLLPKTITTPSLLANIVISKFCDSLPFFRQEKMFSRIGAKILRESMCSWVIKAGEKCKTLVELLRADILSGPLINMDETRVQVLKEPNRHAHQASQMFVMTGGPPGKRGVVYHYSEKRDSTTAKKLLKSYRGIVQTDGYSGYDYLDRCDGIVHAACWAHVRRKFKDVINATLKSGKGVAGTILDEIKVLYKIEAFLSEQQVDTKDTLLIRQEYSKPVIEGLENKIRDAHLKTPKGGILGRALAYTLGQWPRLLKYLDNAVLSMDNNIAENAIRPFVVGRKNWLFFDRPGGAEAGAVFYSLIESARANDLEPFHYLYYLFDRLPHVKHEEQLTTLLPKNFTQEKLEALMAKHRMRLELLSTKNK